MDPITGGLLLGGLGALAGAQGQRQTTTNTIAVGPESALGALGGKTASSNLSELQNLVNAGPQASSIFASNQANDQLAKMLQSFSQGGYMPSQQDTAQAQQFAQSQFAPQQVAQDQQFQQEKQRANQLAAQLGRPVNDPIIQARLSQERMQSQERLGAQQGAFASQFAMQQPQQRLGYTGQLAELQSGLASQAMQNRQALIGLGSQLQGQDQSFRLGAANRSSTTTGGGGMAGAISGGLAGFGAGMNLAGMFGQQVGAQAVNSSQGGGSVLGTGNLNTAFGYGAPAPAPSASIFGQLGGMAPAASGMRAQIGNFNTAPSGPAPAFAQQPGNMFGSLGANVFSSPTPYYPQPANPYGSTYGITPR